MSKLSPDTIRERLSYVDTENLIGRCDQRFRQVYSQIQVSWKDIVTYYAEQGYAWEDAAAQFGLKTGTLKAFCARAELTFPWQGSRGWQARMRHSRSKKGIRPKGHVPPKKHYAFGEHATLMDLIAKHSPPGLSYACVHNRVTRGWPLEQALVAEKGQPLRKPLPFAA